MWLVGKEKMMDEIEYGEKCARSVVNRLMEGIAKTDVRDYSVGIARDRDRDIFTFKIGVSFRSANDVIEFKIERKATGAFLRSTNVRLGDYADLFLKVFLEELNSVELGDSRQPGEIDQD